MTDLPKTLPRPNIFVVGDAKCGTTTLYRMIELSRGGGTTLERKEPHYFSAPELITRISGPGDDLIPGAIARDEADYLADFTHLSPDIRNIADVSPSYLRNPPAAKRIHDFAPDARIVIMLREPAAKVFSQYTHLWSEGREELSFSEAFEKSAERREAGWSDMFDYEGGGYYADSVERYLSIFGPERVKTVLLEEMFGPDSTARDGLATFLGLTFAPGEAPRMNVSGRIKNPVAAALLGNQALRSGAQRLIPSGLRTKISQTIRGSVKTEKPALDPVMATKLRQYYAEDRERLEALLGRKTGWPES